MAKHSFQPYEYAHIEDSKKRLIGSVRKIGKGKALLVIVNQSGEQTNQELWVELQNLTYIPPIMLSQDDLKAIARYDRTLRDITRDAIPTVNFKTEYEYNIVLDDMIAAVKNIKARTPDKDTVMNEYLCPMFYDFDEIIFPEWEEDDEDFDSFSKSRPANDRIMAQCVYDFFNFSFYAMSGEKETVDFTPAKMDIILADIDRYKKGEKIRVWAWFDGWKNTMFDNLNNEKLSTMSEDELQDFRDVIEEMAKDGNARALRTLGYSYYGGDRLYPCDWVKSRDIFLQLMDRDDVSDYDKCTYANTLGYIYYYGRTNDGVPQYEEALKYYTIGAAGGNYESTYKLADMFLKGRGIAVNKVAACNLINMYYKENLDYILHEHFNCKFADIAVKKGNLCRDGIEAGDEYYYYTLAKFAIDKRMLKHDHYGDKKVLKGIEQELERCRYERPLDHSKSESDSDPVMFHALFTSGYSCRIKLNQTASGVTIKAKRIPKKDEAKAAKFLCCYPDRQYCELLDSVTEKVMQVSKCEVFNGDDTFVANAIDLDWGSDYTIVNFMRDDEKVAVLEAKKFMWKLPRSSERGLGGK